jgi:tRNA pseudouridine55 synthase
MAPGQRADTRPVSGIVLVDKPAGVTSNRVLQQTKRLFQARKAGHTGTLDPLATGMLPVCLGAATRVSGLMLGASKRYRVTAEFGVATDTGDAAGAVIERRETQESPLQTVTGILAQFHGSILQTPPMYSALKQAGRPLYELARAGREVPRAPRRVRIHSLESLRFGADSLELRIRCSKGTYIRTLVEDIGRALGCGAHVSALRRTVSGAFRIEEAVPLEQLQADTPASRDARLLSLERLLGGLPRVDLPAALAERFARGQALQIEHAPAGPCSVYGQRGRLLGLGEGRAPGELRPRRLVSHASG